MSDKPQDRTTSHAKSVNLTHEQTALDRALSLKEHFDRAKAAQLPLETLKTQDVQRTGEGSTMVKADAHRHNMQPPSPMRQGPTEVTYNSNLASEKTSADQKILDAQQKHADYIARLKQQNMLNLSNDRGKDGENDRDK